MFTQEDDKMSKHDRPEDGITRREVLGSSAKVATIAGVSAGKSVV